GWMKLPCAHWQNDGGGPGSRNGYTPAPFSTYQTNSPGFHINAGYACFPTAVVAGVVTAGNVPLSQACANPASTDPRKFSSTISASAKLTATMIFASEFTYHFPTMDLKYVGGGTHYNYSAILPEDS